MVAHEISESANELSIDLKKINGWTEQRKKGFNPNRDKQVQEIIFTRKFSINNIMSLKLILIRSPGTTSVCSPVVTVND